MAKQVNRFEAAMQRLELLPPFLALERGLQRAAHHLAPLIVWVFSFRERFQARSQAQPRPTSRWVKEQHYTGGRLTVTVFLAFLSLMTVLSFYLPLRPTESLLEQRTLTAFPKASFSSVLSGDYFAGINTWFADTFPFRESFVKFESELKEFYGFRGKTLTGEITLGDEIPDAPTAPVDLPLDEEEGEDTSAISEAPEQKTEETDTNEGSDNDGSEQYETLGVLLKKGDTAYEIYNFDAEQAQVYAATVNNAATQLAGKAQVYSLIIPTSMGVCIPEKEQLRYHSTNQQEAINYMYSAMSEEVKTVDIFDTMKEGVKDKEYLYFRTDHHWTALGAYRAYAQFTAAAGVRTADLDKDFTEQVFEGFTGSFYRDSGAASDMAANPDTIHAYAPNDVEKCTVTWADGRVSDYPIITDVETWSSTQKYNTFIGSDNPFTVIENPEITDGSSILLIKESFGNCFAPFLAESYQKVYVVDYRYFNSVDSRHLARLVEDEGIKNVLFLNNVSATRGEAVNQIKNFVKQPK